MVSYEDRLPLKWEPSGPEGLREEPGRNRANLFVLETAAAVEDKPAERLSEEHPEIQQELRRLDAKLHVLMEMVARLLKEDAASGTPRPIRIALKTLEFRADADEVGVGEKGAVRLQIQPAVPAPLVIAGTITDEFEHDGKRWVRFEPEHLPDTLRDALSRHVFRHHRRQVAASRRDTPSENDS